MSFLIRIVLLLALVVAFMMASGCQSIKFKNVVKTGATTAVTYAVAGPIPAIANFAVSVGVDEIIPEEKDVSDIQTKEQAVAFVADSLIMNVLYGFIAFLLITNIAVPYITRRWGYNEAKNKYRRNEDAK
jgi:hypothetical protein